MIRFPKRVFVHSSHFHHHGSVSLFDELISLERCRRSFGVDVVRVEDVEVSCKPGKSLLGCDHLKALSSFLFDLPQLQSTKISINFKRL
jgi:hypothetical protein